MELKCNYKLFAQGLMDSSICLLIILICFPMAMAIPGAIRKAIQVFALLLFALSLVFMNKAKEILLLTAMFAFSLLYFTSAWNEMMNASTFLFNSSVCWIFVIYAVLSIKGEIKPKEVLFWLVVVITGITAFTTIIGLRDYPLAVRELGRLASYRGEDIRFLYRSKNIASWGQVYGMVYILGPLLFFFKKSKNLIVLCTIFLTEICILMSQLTFAILLSVIVIALIVTSGKTNFYYLFIICAGVLGVIIAMNLRSILQFVIDVSNGFDLKMLSSKLKDVYNLMINKTVTGDADSRFSLYKKSFDSFIKYPFGIIWNDKILAKNNLGFHSDFFDIIGSLGCCGLIGLLILGFDWIRKLFKVKNRYERRFLFFMFVCFIMIFILNPTFYSPQIWLGAFLLPSLMFTVDTEQI